MLEELTATEHFTTPYATPTPGFKLTTTSTTTSPPLVGPHPEQLLSWRRGHRYSSRPHDPAVGRRSGGHHRRLRLCLRLRVPHCEYSAVIPKFASFLQYVRG